MPNSSFKSTRVAGPNIRNNQYAKGKIQRKQRGDPPAPQAQIVMTVDTRSDGITRTHDPAKAVAPMSDDASVNRAIRGEVAFIEADSYDSRGVRPGLNGAPMVQVSTNVNGLSIDSNFAVAGIITNAGMGKGEDLSKDNAGTLVMGGTAGTTNTGPDIIPPITHVYVTPDPYKMIDQDGNELPAFEDPGLPPTKFLPATRPLNSASVLTLIKRIQGTIHETFDLQPPKTSEELISKLKHNNEQILDIHKSHPLYLYGIMFAAKLLMYFYDDGKPLGFAEKVKFGAYALNCYNDWESKSKNKYAAALDIYGRGLTKKRYRSDINFDTPEKRKHFEREVILMSDNACSNLQEKQHDCLNQTYLGLSLHGSAPGKPLSVIVGHSHW
jgi:hypothetical protein